VNIPIASNGPAPRISSLLIKPVSAICNIDCTYCFYLDRQSDPYQQLPGRRMTEATLERLVDTYLAYAYPGGIFVFQGGEPTLAGAGYFEALCRFQTQYGRAGQVISNSIQTNGMLIDDRWCALFREYDWLVGLSLDGPEEMHDLYRRDKQSRGTWRQVMSGLEVLRKKNVPFNVLCVLSQANVEKPRELYRFFRSLGVAHIQYIPLAEFDGQGRPLPFTITPEQYGRFLCDTFDNWWPDRRAVHIRFFDNIKEALAGKKPSNCTMHETCDSYVVVEHNGDVYPCDFFVERSWKLGNINFESWSEISRRQVRHEFAAKKTLPHAECLVCPYSSICHGGCPKLRQGPRQRFEDLDYFCSAYKTIFAKSLGRLRS